MGDYEAALDAFRQQLRLAEQSKDKLQQARSHEGIATALAHQENYPEALNHYENQLALDRELGQQIHIGHGLINRANMLWRMGRYEEARKSFDEARSLASSGDEEMKEVREIQLFARC
jgi:tetratricopeptide (TPR) repeat protein